MAEQACHGQKTFNGSGLEEEGRSGGGRMLGNISLVIVQSF